MIIYIKLINVLGCLYQQDHNRWTGW